ncbi:Arrestin C-terminal-like domain-containing protein [[Candida] zeylanoides]
MHKKHSKELPLFDIRVRSPHKNLVLLRGNEHECEHVPFQGTVKLSTHEDMHVKRVALRLVGEYKIDYFKRDSAGMVCDQVSETNCVLDVVWSNLLVDEAGVIAFGDYGDTVCRLSKARKAASSTNLARPPAASPGLSPNGSTTNLARPSFLRSKSHSQLDKGAAAATAAALMQIPKSGVDGTPFKDRGATSSNSFLLPQGNYNMPFSVQLPVNISETVEGLRCGHVLYRLECTVERGRFERAFHRSKHIRIVRTLHPQNLNLTESIDINNTWPKKVQYAVSVPRKGVAVGSSVPISFIIVPIAKGLSLRALNGVLVQHYHVASPHSGQSPEYEELFGQQDMAFPDPSTLPVDQWQFKSHFKLPPNLNKLTQTCDLKNGIIQVKHRLRISIQLLNREGHTSELRANLPVYLYISAHSGHAVAQHWDVDALGNFVAQPGSEDVLFRRNEHYHSNSSSRVQSRAHSRTQSMVDLTQETSSSEDDSELDRQDAAPPMYQQHVFDKVYDSSLPQTPLQQFRSQVVSPAGSSTSLQGYFAGPSAIDAAFEANRRKHKHTPSALDLSTMCAVPAYDVAVEEDDEEDADLAPSYSSDERPRLDRAQTTDPSKLHKRHSKGFFKMGHR